ncbi:MAG: ERCC4 domain-containing protein [Candidatus Woesearchaeota archaeon]|nr:ERCC4 domain-containing protein [Candidatus Woesearchaeota archaeon]
MSKIIVDHRERASGIIPELAKHDLEVEVKQLVTADFIIQTIDSNGVIHNVGVEKKTQTDFLNSIIDKRIITQLVMLKENFSVPLLIIEGEDNIYQLRNFHPNAIRGMLAAIAIDFQIPILHTKNFRDTASLLAIIAKRLEKPSRVMSLLAKRKSLTKKQQQEYFMEALPSVGPTLAKNLLNKFKSIKNIMNATEEELQEVDKIGKKKAKEIKELIEHIYD